MLESLASELANELERTLPRPPQALRVHASHGFAIAALMQQLTAAGLQVELRYRNSFESVAALSHGECDLAGFHVPIGEFEVPAAQRYRRWLRDDTHLLVQVGQVGRDQDDEVATTPICWCRWRCARRGCSPPPATRNSCAASPT